MRDVFNFDVMIDALADRLAGKLRTEGSQGAGGPAIRPRLLTVEQAATYLGRTKTSVQHLISDGAFPWSDTTAGYSWMCGISTAGSTQRRCSILRAMPRKPQLGRIYRPKKKRPDGTRTEIRTWWVAYYVNGSQTRESSKSRKYKDAENLLRRRIAERETGVYAGPAAERVKVSELLDELIEDFENNDKIRHMGAVRCWAPTTVLRPHAGGKSTDQGPASLRQEPPG